MLELPVFFDMEGASEGVDEVLGALSNDDATSFFLRDADDSWLGLRVSLWGVGVPEGVDEAFERCSFVGASSGIDGGAEVSSEELRVSLQVKMFEHDFVQIDDGVDDQLEGVGVDDMKAYSGLCTDFCSGKNFPSFNSMFSALILLISAFSSAQEMMSTDAVKGDCEVGRKVL